MNSIYIRTNRSWLLLVTILIILLGSVIAPFPSLARYQKTHSHLSAMQANSKTDKNQKLLTQDSGSLAAITPAGKPLGTCPLKHTDVQASVSGFVSRVTVKQTFTNPFKEKIEAIYTFPLAESGAVDEMLMKVGTRTIRGSIKKREEAKEIYERAKAQGQVASLLDQERTNIFTQSVANIKPGESIEITIRYVELLAYDSGNFSFVFPMVVGPRFIPGEPVGKQGTGMAPDTTRVSDASRITPPITPQGTRAGHDVSLALTIDAGVPIANISSKLHEVDVKKVGDRKARVQLKDEATIPNKDFVLSWQVASDKLQSGYLTYKDGEKGFLTLMIMPPKRVTREQAQPKEMIFLIDCSGSQSGAPLEKAKETMAYVLDHMNAQDTFQVIAFSDHLDILFDKPQIANESMRQQARQFVSRLSANGGTWMAPAVEKACGIPADKHRLRIVTFMTDGYVGNDFEIIGLVKKLRDKSRWFPFGTGNSVNRMLIDMMAREGGGEAEYVLLNSSGAEVGRKFYERIASPVLTDVKISFGGLDVIDVYPKEVSDVWAEKPLYIKTRYGKPGSGTVTISGFAGGKPYSEKLSVTLPAKETDNAVLSSVWARSRVDDLMSKDWFGAQQGSVRDEIKQDIIKTALTYHIMTQYTSFVAVEEKTVTSGGQLKTVTVPVEMPDGVSYEGIFGGNEVDTLRQASAFGNARHKMAAGGGWYRAAQSMNIASGSSGTGCLPCPAPYPACPRPNVATRSDTAKVHGGRLLKDEELAGAKGEVNELRKERDLSKLERTLVSVLADSRTDKKNCTIAGVQISDGKIKVRVLVKKISKEIIGQLEEKGLAIEKSDKARHVVIGTIELSKLTTLADILDVILIRPAP